MRTADGAVGLPSGLLFVLGCLCARQRRGRSLLECTPYSLVGRQPIHSGYWNQQGVSLFSCPSVHAYMFLDFCHRRVKLI
jgi:hypothetical protein